MLVFDLLLVLAGLCGLVAAVLWVLGMAWFLLRGTTAVARFAGRMLFRRARAA